MTLPLSNNKEEDRKKKDRFLRRRKKGGGGFRWQSKKANFSVIYNKLKEYRAKIGDRSDFFRDYAKLLHKNEVLFILDDLNSAFFINTETAEVIKGEAIDVLRFRFHLGGYGNSYHKSEKRDDYFDVDFTEGGVSDE